MSLLLPAGAKAGTYNVDGVAFPRVTTILDVIAKPGLDAWRRRIGFAEADRLSREAAEFGTRLHTMLEGICNGELRGFEPDLALFRDAFDSWFQEHVAEVLATERLVVHHGLRYAGTCDALLRLEDGRIVVADWKSSNRRGETWPLQLVAYQAAISHAKPDEMVNGRIIVQMPSKEPGRLLVHEYDDIQTDWADFKAALRLYRRFGE